MSVKAWVYTQVFSRADSKAWLQSMLLSALGNYYIKFRGIPSGGKSIKMLSRQWYQYYLHVWYNFFDQSACSIFVRCQALVAFSLRSIVKYFFQHEKRNFVYPRGRVISSTSHLVFVIQGFSPAGAGGPMSFLLRPCYKPFLPQIIILKSLRNWYTIKV